MTGNSPRSVAFAGSTDVGRTRTHNEDSFEIDTDLKLLLVADGMGGHIGGDIASKTAIEAINDFILEYEPEPGSNGLAGAAGFDSYASIVRTAAHRANHRIVGMNQERGLPENRGMGTTIVGLWLPEGLDRAVIFHTGDSRVYRLRNGYLTQLTKDHSLYQAWVDNGRYGDPPNRNIIMRALGMIHDVESDVSVEPVENNDIFLLCSDGLTGMVSDDTIIDILSETPRLPLEEACSRLILEANRNGGKDNVTVILAQFK